MSYYLIDFSKSTNDFDFDNLIIGKKIKTDQDNCKYYLYYYNNESDTANESDTSNNSDTPCEIYLKLPKIRLIYNLANHKYDKLSIPIYPNWDLSNEFIDWVKLFEKNIEECFVSNKQKREFISIISKKNMLNFIKCYINEKTKITSNIDDKHISLNDFKINGQIEIVLKISYIWANNNKIGLSSSIYQVKYYAPPEQLDINFIDPDPVRKQLVDIPFDSPSRNTKSIDQQLAIRMQQQIANRNSQQISNQQISNQNPQQIANRIPQQIQIKMTPSLKDLQKVIKSLKPVEYNN